MSDATGSSADVTYCLTINFWSSTQIAVAREREGKILKPVVIRLECAGRSTTDEILAAILKKWRWEADQLYSWKMNGKMYVAHSLEDHPPTLRRFSPVAGSRIEIRYDFRRDHIWRGVVEEVKPVAPTARVRVVSSVGTRPYQYEHEWAEGQFLLSKGEPEEEVTPADQSDFAPVESARFGSDYDDSGVPLDTYGHDEAIDSEEDEWGEGEGEEGAAASGAGGDDGDKRYYLTVNFYEPTLVRMALMAGAIMDSAAVKLYVNPRTTIHDLVSSVLLAWGWSDDRPYVFEMNGMEFSGSTWSSAVPPPAFSLFRPRRNSSFTIRYAGRRKWCWEGKVDSVSLSDPTGRPVTITSLMGSAPNQYGADSDYTYDAEEQEEEEEEDEGECAATAKEGGGMELEVVSCRMNARRTSGASATSSGSLLPFSSPRSSVAAVGTPTAAKRGRRD